MAVIKAVSSKAGIGQALDYVTKEEKTEDKLVSGLHCEPDTVKDEMQATKELWGKTGGRTYKHFVHSYHSTLSSFNRLCGRYCYRCGLSYLPWSKQGV